MHTIVKAVQSYYDRIGAESSNFRRGVVRDFHNGYYTERAVIKFDTDGAITCSNRAYAPTDEEREAIIEEWKTTKYPRSILAEGIDQLLKHVAKDSQLFELRDRRTGHIKMVQERREKADGKSYHPWTLFSDGNWYSMEPDGALPFWKPPVRRNKNRHHRIMVHEGAKSAEFMDRLFNDPDMAEERACHPWAEFLSEYEHWGIIGGAKSPHRADYDELRAERAFEVLYVCDNDREGFDALKTVSKCYGKRLRCARFDNTFPPSWDLADEFPKKMYNKNGQYIGKQFEEFLDTATWATKLVENPSGEGRPSIVISQDHKEEVVHTIKPEAVIFLDKPDDIMTFSEYNNKISPFSDSGATSKYLVKDDVHKGAIIVYDPSKPPGIYSSTEGSGRCVNTHVPTTIKPVKGDPTLWLEFIERLFPVQKDRHHALRWAATLVARPEVRMLHAMLLISEAQGVGKTTFGNILASLVGKHNTSFPSDDEITDSTYNYWIAHKRLALVNEIYAGASVKPYNKLKTIITDPTLTVKKKYLANYTIDNRIHVIACSNSMRALHMAADDRRWFVPGVTEEVAPPEYWDEFNRWLEFEHGLGIILHWAHEFLKQNKPITASEKAPISEKKKELITESLSPGLLVVDGFLRFVMQYQEKIEDERYVICDTDLVDIIRFVLYEGQQNDRLERRRTVRNHAKSLGLHVSGERFYFPEWHCAATGPRLICSHKEDAKKDPKELFAELTAAGIKPLDIRDIYSTKTTVTGQAECFGAKPEEASNEEEAPNEECDGKVVQLKGSADQRKK